MTLSTRQKRILKAIVDDYILTAIPVGSRTIAKKYETALSPATIRNEMSDLEAMGYLEQPHTSAGRVPSEKAYRLYVDQLMGISKITPKEAQAIHQHLSKRVDEVEEVIHQAAKAISDLTSYTAVVLAPQMQKLVIEHIQMVLVSPGCALLVIVTQMGLLKDSLIRIPLDADQDTLNVFSKMLTHLFQGCCFEDIDVQLIDELSEGLQQRKAILGQIFEAINRQMQSSESRELVVEGTRNILNFPEYSDIEKAKDFLSLLETTDELHALLRKCTSVEFNITIGKENPWARTHDVSIVTASYRVDHGASGTLGIIGPTRMDYAGIVSILSYMGKSMSEILSGSLHR